MFDALQGLEIMNTHAQQIHKYTCACEMYVYLEAIESPFPEYI